MSDEEKMVDENATEMSEEQRNAICYKSKLLNKYFDTYEELVAAEEPIRKAEEEKKQRALTRKEDAAPVQEAFEKRNAARKAWNEAEAEASKICAAAIAAAKEAYNKALEEPNKALDEAEADFDTKLKAFQSNHPEGYHITLKDGDNTLTVRNYALNQHLNRFDNFVHNWFNDWFDRFPF